MNSALKLGIRYLSAHFIQLPTVCSVSHIHLFMFLFLFYSYNSDDGDNNMMMIKMVKMMINSGYPVLTFSTCYLVNIIILFFRCVCTMAKSDH